MNRLLIRIIILFLMVSCQKEKSQIIDISKVNVNVSVDRFEQKFYASSEITLPKLKKEYPYLFPIQTPDSVWLNKINNTGEKELFKKSQKVFADFSNEKSQIEDLFKHIKYYHPSFKSPKIITLITNLDYESKVIYADSLMFISLDMYLGKSSNVYKDFPIYLSHNFDKTQLVVDIAKAISERYYKSTKKRQFINSIIDEGKRMYLINSYIPSVSEAQKMEWNTEKLAWAKANETQVWKYFIENKLLYSTDSKLYTRFIANAPFSKFYIDIDKESPGKIGVWLGWQIVQSYMNNNNVTLHQLLQTKPEEIFKKSKYKPKK